jgi:uncharacterized protein YjbI with pentapeptide repeats
MAKRHAATLNRLAGKKLVFSGKFAYGVEDSLKAMAEAQQGAVCDDLTEKVDYLVLADLGAGKTLQKKTVALNAKGATIQVIDVDAFKNLADPTEDEILALFRAGESETYAKIHGFGYHQFRKQSPQCAFHSEDLSSVSFTNASLDDIRFDGCRFVGAKFERVGIEAATDCDFSQATGHSSRFGDVPRCRFNQATLKGCHFTGDFSGADFTGAALEEASFTDMGYYAQLRAAKPVRAGALFKNGSLKSAKFHGLHLKAPDFGGADLTKAEFQNCSIDSGDFGRATLREAVLVGCKLAGADLSHADLTGANLASTDLTGATLAGANLKNANLRGTKLDGVDLSKAKNYDPGGAAGGTVGPALTELDVLNASAKRIQVVFQVRSSEGEAGEQVEIDGSRLKWGWGVQVPQSIGARPLFRHGSPLTFSDAMIQLANVAGHLQVCWETVEVSSTKSPTGGKQLRDLVMRGIAEAFAQEVPPEEELAEATKKHRAAEREKGAAGRERREQAKAAAAKEKEQAKKQIAKKIAKTVGKVSDVASFLKALEVRIEKPKIDKATKMLKASGFKLFNDVSDECLSGVVKSQTDPDLVYACRVMHDGQYACCTQNLNVCGGLRGSICKHLLVLIIGLVQAGELDPTTIDGWIAKTHSVKPELDKEVMGAIFIKYKGAEAGEVDWRPTETVPEDYYTL